jgi:hypothetical protein
MSMYVVERLEAGIANSGGSRRLLGAKTFAKPSKMVLVPKRVACQALSPTRYRYVCRTAAVAQGKSRFLEKS